MYKRIIKCVCGKEFKKINFKKHYKICELFLDKYNIFDYKISKILGEYLFDKKNLILIRFLIERYLKLIDKKIKEYSYVINNNIISNKDKILENQIEDIQISFGKNLKEKEVKNICLNKILGINPNKLIEFVNFKTEPNTLRKWKIITDVLDGGWGMNDHFAVYNLVKDPKKIVYVAIKNKLENSQSSFINILQIKSENNYKIIQRLYGHNQRIVFVQYYLDPYTDNEYLLSADQEDIVIVWKILDKNNYKRFIYINTFYGEFLMGQSICSCLIFFTERKNYIYTTSKTNNFGKLYELEDGAFKRNVSITINNYTIYLIKYKEYIIDICKDYIMIYNPFNEEIYDKIENEQLSGENRSGCITYNKDNSDYLSISNENGFIIIYDLIKKNIFKIIQTDGEFYHIISWNLKYLIVAVYNQNSLWIVDFNGNIDKNTFTNLNEHPICVKKSILNGEEVILCSGGEDNNSLYIYFPSQI